MPADYLHPPAIALHPMIRSMTIPDPSGFPVSATPNDLHTQTATFHADVQRRSDRLMNYFLISFFLGGIYLAHYYETYTIAFSVGGLSLIAYYSVKLLLPQIGRASCRERV